MTKKRKKTRRRQLVGAAALARAQHQSQDVEAKSQESRATTRTIEQPSTAVIASIQDPRRNPVREAHRPPRAYRHATRRSAFASLFSHGWAGLGWLLLLLLPDHRNHDNPATSAPPSALLARMQAFTHDTARPFHACRRSEYAHASALPSRLPDRQTDR
ncbi:hypothetical protein IWZ00DRAFT_528260 [Phyllosticta capitalensis]|uniref:Uncharacterized protein n=1 Tax=Phyllosticta capitalensis TaxID=121624 RepID=A0ABR1Z0M4_9PEZI